MMEEVGCEVHGQRPKRVSELADMKFDVVITLDERSLPAPSAALASGHWRIPDPHFLDSKRYRDIRHDIGHRVRKLLEVVELQPKLIHPIQLGVE